jgi:hypothetical protein
MSKFENKLNTLKDSFLKGLFCMPKKSQINNLILFGFQNFENFSQEYKEKYLRIPKKYLKDDTSVIQKQLLDAQNTTKQFIYPIISETQSSNE